MDNSPRSTPVGTPTNKYKELKDSEIRTPTHN